MPDTLLDLHAAAIDALNAGDDDRLAYLRDLIERVGDFYRGRAS